MGKESVDRASGSGSNNDNGGVQDGEVVASKARNVVKKRKRVIEQSIDEVPLCEDILQGYDRDPSYADPDFTSNMSQRRKWYLAAQW